MIRNIDQSVPEHESKGYGGEHSIPHHKTKIGGKLVSRLTDGCWQNKSCDNCDIPLDKCSGNIPKIRH